MNSLSIPSSDTLQGEKRPLQGPLLFAIADLGVPIFLFGAVFLVLTIGVTKLLSPDRFPVHIAEKVIRLSDLSAEEARLHAEHDALTVERAELLKSQDTAPVLSMVTARRNALFPIGSVLLSIEALRTSFRTTNLDPITLPTIEYDGAEQTLTLGGFVTDTTGGSNHILSNFVDGLRTLPTITSVSEPEYTQDTSELGVPRTPFILTLHFSS